MHLVQWCALLIPGLSEAEAEGFRVQDPHGQLSDALCQNIKTEKRPGCV